MSKYDVKIEDPNFKSACQNLVTEHRDASIYFLKHGSTAKLKDVDYSTDIGGWLHMQRQNLHVNLKNEFDTVYEKFDFKNSTDKNDKLIEFSNKRIDILDKQGCDFNHIASYCQPIKNEPLTALTSQKVNSAIDKLNEKFASNVAQDYIINEKILGAKFPKKP